MGETGITHATSGMASFWNPALNSTGDVVVDLQMFRWTGDSKGNLIGMKSPASWGGMSIFYMSNSIEEFEARQVPGAPLADFAVRQTVIAGGAAVDVMRNLTIGANLKWAGEDINGDVESAFGIVDIGLLYRHSDLSVAGTASNYGNFAGVDADQLPPTLRIGISYNQQLGVVYSTLAIESVFEDTYTPFHHIGIEVGYPDLILLRAGYMSEHHTRSLTYGAGFKHKRYSIDFSYTPMTNNLGNAWEVGLGIRL